jgi:hypothetical protein
MCSPAATAQPPSEPPPAAEVAPAITFEETAVLVSGATPEGDVVVFGLGRDRERAIPRTLRMEQRLAADLDGALRWELPEPVMARSVWAAVDLATGEYVLAAPEGHELDRVELPAQGLGANARFLEHEGRFLDLLLVRPASGPGGEEAVGFWGVAMGDGAGLDRDGEANSRLTLDVIDLLALGDSPPAPERLSPKDVLVGVDPQTLRVYAVRLADAPEDGSVGDDGSGEGEE